MTGTVTVDIGDREGKRKMMERLMKSKIKGILKMQTPASL